MHSFNRVLSIHQNHLRPILLLVERQVYPPRLPEDRDGGCFATGAEVLLEVHWALEVLEQRGGSLRHHVLHVVAFDGRNAPHAQVPGVGLHRLHEMPAELVDPMELCDLHAVAVSWESCRALPKLSNGFNEKSCSGQFTVIYGCMSYS
jgi:hypothetical protein